MMDYGEFTNPKFYNEYELPQIAGYVQCSIQLIFTLEFISIYIRKYFFFSFFSFDNETIHYTNVALHVKIQ